MIMRNGRRFLCATALTCLAVTTHDMAFAQSSDPQQVDAADNDGAIVVTARGRE